MSERLSEAARAEYPALGKLFKKWEILSGNLKNTELKAPILLPDLFVEADDGCGITELIGHIGDFLFEHRNLMDFYGDVRSIQFMLNYAAAGTDFDEMLRFMQEIKHAAGFRNQFKGIVHVDVSEWLGHSEEKHFIEFLNYLADNSGDWMIVLTVRNNPKRKADIEAMEATLSMFLRLETLKLSLPKADYFLGVLKDKLLAYGIKLTPDAEALMTETLRLLRKNKYFDGRFTVGILSQDIVYTIYSRPGVKDEALNARELSEFGPESEYVSRTVQKMEMTKRIGFDA